MKRIKEFINNFLLIWSKMDVIITSWEHDCKNCIFKVVSFFMFGSVDYMNFKIKSLSIDSMFWARMHMELCCLEFSISTIKYLPHVWLKFILILFLQGYFCTFSIPFNYCILLIGIFLFKLIKFDILFHIRTWIRFEINRWLHIFGASWKFLCPVCTIFLVVKHDFLFFLRIMLLLLL